MRPPWIINVTGRGGDTGGSAPRPVGSVTLSCGPSPGDALNEKPAIGRHPRASEVLSLTRPLSYRASHEIAGENYFAGDDYFRRSFSPLCVVAKREVSLVGTAQRPLRKDKERGRAGDKESRRQGFKIISILVSHSPPIHVFQSLPLLVSFPLYLSAPPSQMEFRSALKMSACERAGV